MKGRALFLLATLFVVMMACNRDDSLTQLPEADSLRFKLDLPETPFSYSELNLPDHVANNVQLAVYAASNTPNSNPTTDAGATLGRALFYDKRLSQDNSISCGSCHLQSNAFADPNQFSVGINNQVSTRNSMSLANMLYYQDFFWDMRADGLENQVLQPIEDHTEMGSNLNDVIDELSEAEEYASLFVSAFGDEEITEQRISRALSQFLRSMVSFDSKWDQELASDWAGFSTLERDGKDLFFSTDHRCGQCHSSQVFFTRLEPATNGLDSVITDNGYFDKTGNEAHLGQFKIVSLRNVEYTAPYMHDGRFQTLDEVLDHYSHSIQARPNLDERLTVEYEPGGTPLEMNFSTYEKEALIAFMKTLSDENFISDERFSDPFMLFE